MKKIKLPNNEWLIVINNKNDINFHYPKSDPYNVSVYNDSDFKLIVIKNNIIFLTKYFKNININKDYRFSYINYITKEIVESVNVFLRITISNYGESFTFEKNVGKNIIMYDLKNNKAYPIYLQKDIEYNEDDLKTNIMKYLLEN